MGIEHVINYDLPSYMHGGIQEYTHRIGRTARIGHTGLATSFYNERDEGLAQDLVNVLVECGCEVPEFLNHLIPEEGGKIEFNDDSDDEGADGEADEGGFPAPFDAGSAGTALNGWGASASTKVEADAPFFAAATSNAPEVAAGSARW